MAGLSEVRIAEAPEGLRMVSEWWLVLVLCAGMLLRWVPGTWINPTFFQVGLFGMAAVWALEMIRRPYRVRGSFVLIPMGVAAIWPVVQLVLGQTISRWETEQAVVLWCGNFAAVFFGIQLISGSKRRVRMLQVLALFAFMVILGSLLEHFSSPDKILWFFEPGYSNIFGIFVNRDRYASFAELAMSLFVGLAFQRRRYSAMWLGMAATAVAGIIGSASRAGAILATFETVTLLFLVQRRRKSAANRSSGKIWLFAGMTAVFTVVVGVGALTDRLGDPDPYYGRREMLQSSLEMVPQRALFGFGLENFQNAYPPYAKFDSDKVVNHAHNDWAEWAVDGGAPFFGAMLLVFAWTLPKALRSIWGFGVVIMFAHGLVDFPLHDPASEVWLFTLLGGLAMSPATESD